MRSAISTGIIGTSPRRLQLYPSLGKHFQTTPVPVHFNGNKMMMKMQTTYSSHVLFCGVSKQQDYSNTNTAVSLLPPTQETPKMILRRILVSIVSSAALLLYSSLFISHCFAKAMPSVQRNIKYVNCSVCEVVALQLFNKIKEDHPLDSEQPYNDPETNIIAIAENVCKLRKNDDWIWEIPIEKENWENTERLVCDKTICNEDPTKKEKICNKVMENVKSDFAKFICYQWSGELKSLKAYLCENQTKVCSTGHDEPKKELVDVETQSKGISPELIDLLPTSKCKEKVRPNFLGKIKRFVSKKKSERCVVCLMKHKRGDRQITLPCKHVYHSKCINKVCPVCKKEVFGNESN